MPRGFAPIYADLGDVAWAESEAARAVRNALACRPIVTVDLVRRYHGGGTYAVRQALEVQVRAGTLRRWRSRNRRFPSTCYFRA